VALKQLKVRTLQFFGTYLLIQNEGIHFPSRKFAPASSRLVSLFYGFLHETISALDGARRGSLNKVKKHRDAQQERF
jgi:hypothetical protein